MNRSGIACALTILAWSCAFTASVADTVESGGIDVPMTDSGSSPEPESLFGLSAAGSQLYDHGDPSAIEQLMIEFINRARSDPGAEADRFGIDLNDGLNPGTIVDSPKQPLAFHPDLIDAARGHSQWMLDTDTFSHTGAGGSTPGDRMASAGYTFTGSWAWGENISWRGTTGTPNYVEFTRRMHESLFRSPGHRRNMLNGVFDEGGIGLVSGKFFSDGTNYNALMGTQNFARTSSTPGPLLVRVVYDDHNGNGTYEVGEGIGGVNVHPVDGDYYAVTSSSGGFAVPYIGTEEFFVEFSGGPLVTPFQVSTIGTGLNVKLDVSPPPYKAKEDFDFDGRSDLFWRHATNGRNVVWFMNGAQRVGAGDLITVSDPDWEIAGFGDFNGDGHSDILWRSLSTGRNVIWFMDGLTRTGSGDTTPLNNAAWHLAALRDFDGDGKTDMLWRDSLSGRNVMWFMNGATRTASGDTLGLSHPDWDLAGFGDFNGDGRTDMLWRNNANGRNVIWLMDGLDRVGHGDTVSLSDPAWELAGLEDFDGDGRTDLLWRNGINGRNVMWFMNGTSRAASGDTLGLNDPDWTLTGFGDYNGDGRADFLWHSESTGRNVMWFMDGTTRIGAGDTVTLQFDPWFPRME